MEISRCRCKCADAAACGRCALVTQLETEAGPDSDTVDGAMQGRLTATLADREQHSWDVQQDILRFAVEHAAEHSAALGNSCGFLLYGGAGLNSYISEPGLQMVTADFDFTVVASSGDNFVQQVEEMLASVNGALSRPVCELKWPSELEGIATLVIDRRRLVDMKMMEACEFRRICSEYGQPVRAPAAQEGLHDVQWRLRRIWSHCWRQIQSGQAGD